LGDRQLHGGRLRLWGKGGIRHQKISTMLSLWKLTPLLS
jgi:hypothetical protein